MRPLELPNETIQLRTLAQLVKGKGLQQEGYQVNFAYALGELVTPSALNRL